MATLQSVIMRDLAANRPSAGTPGRIFIASDTASLSRDNGTTWDSISTSITLQHGGSSNGSQSTLNLIAGTNISVTDNGTGGITIAVTGSPYDVVCSLTGKPGAAAIVFLLTFTRAVTFAGNFSGSYGTVGTNPTATATYTVNKNGSSIGTVAISTGGVFTFASTSGASQSFAAGDRMTIVAPTSQDTTLSDTAFTLAGTR